MKALAAVYAKANGTFTHVRVLIRDISDSWTGNPLKRTRYVQQANITHNGKLVFRTRLSRWTPVDPSFELRLAGGKPGDSMRLIWQDNQGVVRAIEAVIR